jgi:hypothetical protein
MVIIIITIIILLLLLSPVGGGAWSKDRALIEVAVPANPHRGHIPPDPHPFPHYALPRARQGDSLLTQCLKSNGDHWEIVIMKHRGAAMWNGDNNITS